MNEQEPADPQLQHFILAETQKQRFQVISTLIIQFSNVENHTKLTRMEFLQ